MVLLVQIISEKVALYQNTLNRNKLILIVKNLMLTESFLISCALTIPVVAPNLFPYSYLIHLS